MTPTPECTKESRNSEVSDSKKNTSALGLSAPVAKPIESSGVVFYPPSQKYWRIGGKWYDFEPFVDKHPGGAEVLMMARDRFEDCTFVFESHHHNYQRARAIIKQYEVPEDKVLAAGLMQRPKRSSDQNGHHDKYLDAQESPKLLDDEAFYSVMRRRVTKHLRDVGYPGGGPTMQCIILFWLIFLLWLVSWTAILSLGNCLSAVCLGILATWLGAFGWGSRKW